MSDFGFAWANISSDSSSLVAQRLPIPLRDVCGPYPDSAHLEGRDQPFETQLQTAWASFGKQTRVTSACVEGGIRQIG